MNGIFSGYDKGDKPNNKTHNGRKNNMGGINRKFTGFQYNRIIFINGEKSFWGIFDFIGPGFHFLFMGRK